MKTIKRDELTVDDYKIKLAEARRRYLLDAAEIKYGLVSKDELKKQRGETTGDKDTKPPKPRDIQ